MKTSTLFTALLTLPAAAAAQDDVYKSLALGDRVQITFRSGNTISGRLVPSPLSVQGKAKDAPRVSLAAGPFDILYFHDDSDICKTQEQILEEWRKRHVDGKLQAVASGTKPELWELYSAQATPTLVFVDRTTGRTIASAGLQSDGKLEEMLTRLRTKGGSETDGPDYARDRTLTIDLSWEYPGLNGTMTIDKKEIREIRKLQNLDEKTLQALAAEKKKIQAELERQNAELRKANAEREKAALAEIEEKRRREEENLQSTSQEAELRMKLEKMKKYKDILGKFPPSKWNEKKLDEIARKTQSRIPVTPEEREFMANFGLWKEAVSAQEAEKKSVEEKKKKEEKSPEEKK
jgi:hypothetical protein